LAEKTFYLLFPFAFFFADFFFGFALALQPQVLHIFLSFQILCSINQLYSNRPFKTKSINNLSTTKKTK